MVEIN